MKRERGTVQLSRLVRAAVIVVAAIALLGGCFPPQLTPGVAFTPEVPPTTPTPISAGAETVTPVSSETPATLVPTAVVTATTVVTASPALTVTVLPTDLAVGMVVQKADNSIQVVDASGSAMPLYQAASKVDMTAIFPPSNGAGSSLYLPLSGAPGPVVKVDATGGQVVPAITGQVYGIAVLGEKLAYSVADLSASPVASEIRVSGLDGAQATTVYSQTAATAPTVLRVMRWAPDGKHLYFGKEPVGLGGYILFGGLTNIWELDVQTGQATELVPARAQNAMVCIDDLAPLAKTAADHCNPLTMELIDVATGITRTVTLPADVPAFGTTGGARFSPDGKSLAFGLARRNPDNEQGWVAVADVAGATAQLIATSPANDYFSVVGWQDADTLILQSAGPVPGVWTVGIDGQGLKRVSDGIFLGTLSAQP